MSGDTMNPATTIDTVDWGAVHRGELVPPRTVVVPEKDDAGDRPRAYDDRYCRSIYEDYSFFSGGYTPSRDEAAHYSLAGNLLGYRTADGWETVGEHRTKTGGRCMSDRGRLFVRDACRKRQPLGGADAQALEGALTMTERERDEARASLAVVEAERDKARADYQFMVDRAAWDKLEGYRELGMKAAEAEAERDRAYAEVAHYRRFMGDGADGETIQRMWDLTVERDRLREALETIPEKLRDHADSTRRHSADLGAAGAYRHAARVVSAALAALTKEDET